MPSSSARQRNKRALESTGGVSKVTHYSNNKKGKAGSSIASAAATAGSTGSRLQRLLTILLFTTVVLVALQVARFYYRGNAAFAPLTELTKTKYGHSDHHQSSVGGGIIVNSDVTSPSSVPKFNEKGEQDDEIDHLLEAQFDEDGNLDMATIQRMLDLVYGRPERRETVDKEDEVEVIQVGSKDDKKHSTQENQDQDKKEEPLLLLG